MRARLDVLRRWEARNSLPSMFGGVAMGAQRASWTSAFQAETAAISVRHHEAVFFDIVKCFERVPHDVLARMAALAGYPVIPLRLAIAAYRLARAVGIAGVFARLVVANCGITAGSGSATSELRALLLQMICLLYTSPSPRDQRGSRMPSSA